MYRDFYWCKLYLESWKRHIRDNTNNKAVEIEVEDWKSRYTKV